LQLVNHKGKLSYNRIWWKTASQAQATTKSNYNLHTNPNPTHNTDLNTNSSL